MGAGVGTSPEIRKNPTKTIMMGEG